MGGGDKKWRNQHKAGVCVISRILSKGVCVCDAHFTCMCSGITRKHQSPSNYSFEPGSLLELRTCIFSAMQEARKPQWSSCLHTLQSWDSRHAQDASRFLLCGCWDLSSSSHNCTAGTLNHWTVSAAWSGFFYRLKGGRTFGVAGSAWRKPSDPRSAGLRRICTWPTHPCIR